MSQQMTVRFVDDLDGSEASGTVYFGLDGRRYEIDLSEANAGQLREALWGSRTQAVGVDQQFQATRSYSLMSPPSTGWRLIRGRSRFGTG